MLFYVRKYLQYLQEKFADDLKALLDQLAAQKEIEALTEQNRLEREAAEKALRENGEEMDKLEQETVRVTNQLAESTN